MTTSKRTNNDLQNTTQKTIEYNEIGYIRGWIEVFPNG